MDKTSTPKKLVLNKETLQQLKVKTNIKAGVSRSKTSGGNTDDNHNEILL